MIDAHELGNIDLVRRLMKASSEYVFVTNMSTFAGTGAVGVGTSGTNVTMTLNSNGLALSVDPPGAGGGAALRGSGTYSQNTGTVQFANSNNMTFGLSSDGIMTGSFSVTAGYLTTAMASDAGSLYQSAGAYLTTAMASDAGSLYQSAGAYLTTAMASDAGSLYQSAGAYLTTAAASDHGHTDKAGVGTSLTSTGGINMVFTLNSNGLSLNVPKWITTYAAGGGQIDISAGASSDSLASLVFVNSNNVSFGLAGSTITASIAAAASNHTHSDLYAPTGAYLTTAAQSGHTHSDLYPPVAGTSAYNYTVLSNSLQITGAYLTTAAQSGHTHSDIYQPIGAYLTTAMASDAGSLYQSAGAYLTTAAVSGHTHSDLYAPTGAYLTTAAVSNHAHSDLQSAGAYLTTAMASDAGSLYQSAGAYLTTAMASDAGSLYQSAGAYLTTAAQSGHTHSDLYQGTGAYLTTAAQSGHTHSDIYQGTGAYLTTAMASDAGSLYQSAGAYLTTAMASDAGSLYQSAGAYLTTAAISDHTHSNKAGIGTTIGATNGTLIKVTLNTDGLNISMPAYITTYTPGVGGGDWSVVTVAGTDMAITTGAATNTLYYPKYIITAAASDHIHSNKAGIGTSLTTTGGTDFLYTLNTDGLSIKIPAYITTYVGGGGGDWATATTNAGTAMSVSTGAATHTLYYPKYLTTAAAGGNVYYGDGSGISWGSSVDGVSTTITGSIVTSYLSASLQSTGAYLTTAAQSGHTHSGDGMVAFLEPYIQTNTSAWVPGVGSWYFAPFNAPGALGGGRLNFLANNTSTAGIVVDVTGSYHSSQTGGKNQSYTYQLSVALWAQDGTGANSTRWSSVWGNTFSYGISHRVSISQSGAASNVSASVYHSISYLQNIGPNGETTVSQFATSNAASGTNTSMASTWMRTDGASIRNMLSNQQMLVVPFNTTISEGNYILGIMYSTTHATVTSGTSYPAASALIMSQLNIVGVAKAALAGYRIFGQTTSNVSDSPFFGAGVVYSAASALAPQYLRTEDMRTIANGIVPYFNFQRRGLTN